jgi:hypothetical protein
VLACAEESGTASVTGVAERLGVITDEQVAILITRSILATRRYRA